MTDLLGCTSQPSLGLCPHMIRIDIIEILYTGIIIDSISQILGLPCLYMCNSSPSITNLLFSYTCAVFTTPNREVRCYSVFIICFRCNTYYPKVLCLVKNLVCHLNFIIGLQIVKDRIH